MSNYTFASMPSVSIQRSKFVRPQPHNTSFNLGELVILGLDECIPGSTHKIELGSLIRMSTPIAPIMDDIQFDVYSFFCPLRLTWTHWKNFMGESEQAGIPTTTYTIPYRDVIGSEINTIADDMGLTPRRPGVSGSAGRISLLPFRAVGLIYNRFFRNQNVEAPILIDTSDANYILSGSSASNDRLFTGLTDAITASDTGVPERLKAYKLPDYVTSCLPYAIKGSPVLIPGTDTAIPVVPGADHALPATDFKIKYLSGGTTWTAPTDNSVLGQSASNGRFVHGLNGDYSQQVPWGISNLWTNPSVLTKNTIDDLRFAFQLNKALYKDALYGSRYWEVLRAHYAVTSPDATLQDPELLGHIKFDINISQVLQTTGYSSPTSTNLGTPGANSVTANKGHLFTASFCEHGYLIHIGVARQKRHTYSNCINRLWTRSSRWDFYHPVFANLGAKKVELRELYVPTYADQGNGILPTDTFGFQESWAEYRFLNPYNSGYLNPYRAGALDYWTLADRNTSAPTLSKSFLIEDRTNLAACLTTGSSGPDFIGSFYFKDTVVNPMPLYSIPGFADHH